MRHKNGSFIQFMTLCYHYRLLNFLFRLFIGLSCGGLRLSRLCSNLFTYCIMSSFFYRKKYENKNASYFLCGENCTHARMNFVIDRSIKIMAFVVFQLLFKPDIPTLNQIPQIIMITIFYLLAGDH